MPPQGPHFIPLSGRPVSLSPGQRHPSETPCHPLRDPPILSDAVASLSALITLSVTPPVSPDPLDVTPTLLRAMPCSALRDPQEPQVSSLPLLKNPPHPLCALLSAPVIPIAVPAGQWPPTTSPVTPHHFH